MKYQVLFTTTASYVVTVESESPDTAIEEAYDLLPSGVCAQCSGWGRDYSLDFGEWDDGEVLDV